MQYTLRGKINNVTPLTLDKSLTLEGASADAKAVGDAIKKVDNTVTDHKNAENPHKVTASQLGLGNVNNTSDADKPVSTKQAEAIKVVADETAKKATTATFSGVFTSGGWSAEAPFTQEITVEGILETDYPIVDIDLSDVADVIPVFEAWNMVGRCTASADNTVVAYCYEDKPEVDIPVIFKVVR